MEYKKRSNPTSSQKPTTPTPAPQEVPYAIYTTRPRTPRPQRHTTTTVVMRAPARTRITGVSRCFSRGSAGRGWRFSCRGVGGRGFLFVLVWSLSLLVSWPRVGDLVRGVVRVRGMGPRLLW